MSQRRELQAVHDDVDVAEAEALRARPGPRIPHDVIEARGSGGWDWPNYEPCTRSMAPRTLSASTASVACHRHVAHREMPGKITL